MEKGGHESYYEIDIDSHVLRSRGSRQGGDWEVREVNKFGIDICGVRVATRIGSQGIADSLP